MSDIDRSDQEELLTVLMSFLDSEVELFCFHLGVEQSVLRRNGARSNFVLDIIQYISGNDISHEQLVSALQKVRPGVTLRKLKMPTRLEVLRLQYRYVFASVGFFVIIAFIIVFVVGIVKYSLLEKDYEDVRMIVGEMESVCLKTDKKQPLLSQDCSTLRDMVGRLSKKMKGASP